MVMKIYESWEVVTEIKNVRFSEACSKVQVRLESDEWQDISDGWKVKPECNPEVASKLAT